MILAANPFYDAYVLSDTMGKAIFIALISLSVISWIVVLYKLFLAKSVKRQCTQFYQILQKNKFNLLGLEFASDQKWNPYFELYAVLKKYTLELLNKNRRFRQKWRNEEDENTSYLSPTDINFVASHLTTEIATQTKNLEKNLFILSTIVSLAPFLGLLGTVWGILTTFSQMQTQTHGGTNQVILGGISLALATTVIGLIDAIPALIGYNYLKNHARDFEVDLHGFSNEILSTVELQYRKVDVWGD